LAHCVLTDFVCQSVIVEGRVPGDAGRHDPPLEAVGRGHPLHRVGPVVHHQDGDVGSAVDVEAYVMDAQG
jgi:hypothetical protein